jgi:TonB family protein
MVFVLLAALLLSGCATFQPTYAPDTLPRLVKQDPLPPWPFRTINNEVTLDINIRVGSDGSVKDVTFLTPGLSKEWDALALETIRAWKFSPAIAEGRPVALWLHQTLRLRFEEAAYLRLAEIVCRDQQAADSVYALLDEGVPFDSLARVCSISDSRTEGGFLGDVDLRTMPLSVRREVQNIRVDHFTHPILLGRNYVIYKCLPAGFRARPAS